MSEDGETYLGGFYSPIGVTFGGLMAQLRPFQAPGSTIGGGVYATNKRLLILGGGKAWFPSKLNKIAAGADKGDFVPSILTMEQNNAIIDLLTANKRFEFGKSQVSQIEVKRPAGVLRTGSLKITSADGQTLEIKLGLKMQHEWTIRVVQSFKPETVKLD